MAEYREPAKPKDDNNKISIADKVVVITGASMGIGEAIAKLFADERARVVLLSRDAGRAEAARDVLATPRTRWRSCDVRNREEIDVSSALPCTIFNASTSGSITPGTDSWTRRPRGYDRLPRNV